LFSFRTATDDSSGRSESVFVFRVFGRFCIRLASSIEALELAVVDVLQYQQQCCVEVTVSVTLFLLKASSTYQECIVVSGKSNSQILINLFQIVTFPTPIH